MRLYFFPDPTLKHLLILYPHLFGNFIPPLVSISFLSSSRWAFCQLSFISSLEIKFINVLISKFRFIKKVIKFILIIFMDYIVKCCQCCRKACLYIWCEIRVVSQNGKLIFQNTKHSFNNVAC